MASTSCLESLHSNVMMSVVGAPNEHGSALDIREGETAGTLVSK